MQIATSTFKYSHVSYQKSIKWKIRDCNLRSDFTYLRQNLQPVRAHFSSLQLGIGTAFQKNSGKLIP